MYMYVFICVVYLVLFVIVFVYVLIICNKLIRYRVRVMVFNATCNNISIIYWRSVLLVDETGVPGENH